MKVRLAPTLVAAAHCAQDRPLTSLPYTPSLEPAFIGRTASARSRHDALFWSSGGQLAVRRGKWKLVKDGKLFDGTPDGDKPLAGEDSLFLSNLEEDPAESMNLRRQFPVMVDELATLMQKWSEEVKK